MPLIPTVMPEEKDKSPNLLGTPGINLPENADEIEAFKQVRDVDAKALNEKLQAQDQAKAKPTPGIQLPQNAADIKEFSEVSKQDPKELNAKLQK